MLDERGGISPFGWAVNFGGHSPSRFRQDVHHLVDWSVGSWKRHFPAEQGYQVSVDKSRDASNAQALLLTVRRGEFHAQVAVEQDLRRDDRGPRCVRMHGRAQFEALSRAHALGERLVSRTRAIGWGGGVALFLCLAWLMVGVRDPVYVLGGMLLVVALLLTVMAGGTLGAWFGERLAEIHRGRAHRQVHADPGLSDDIRRWKAISRQLNARRAVLLGHRRQPFRSEPRALAG